MVGILYIKSLLALRRSMDKLIDDEIEKCINGEGDSEWLMECLQCILSTNGALQGRYKDYECMQWIEERCD